MVTSRQRRWLGTAIAVLLGLQLVVAIGASADDPLTQQLPVTTWTVVPDSLDAVGAYFAAFHVPSPVAGQATENKWQHGLVFRFTGAPGPFGIVSLDTDGAQRFASIALNDGTGAVSEARFPYAWGPDKFYFVYAAMLPGNAIAGFVYDVDATAFTFIGALRAQSAWGSISGTVSTIVRWYGADQSECANYPRTDSFWSLPFGFVPGDANPHPALLPADFVAPGDCPATVTDEPDPLTFRHYVAGSVSGPTTTSSSTSSSSTSSSSTTSSSTTTTEATSTTTSTSTTSTSTTSTTVGG